MKIIFLDIDGVLNDHVPWANGYCGLKAACIMILNLIIAAEPNVKIVISSAWRYSVLGGEMTIKGFEYMLIVAGANVNNRVIGITRKDDGSGWHEQHQGWDERRAQILEYVEKDDDITSYVVLDDMPLSMRHQVQTDPDVGLQELDVKKALDILRIDKRCVKCKRFVPVFTNSLGYCGPCFGQE